MRVAQRRRRRPKTRKIDACPALKARVLADLERSRTPRQIARRLRAEATDETLEPCKGSPKTGGSGCVSRSDLHLALRHAPGKTA